MCRSQLQTSHYLHELPCSSQTPEKIDNLMKELKLFPIPLTKLEKLMICNNPPETVLQLSLVSILVILFIISIYSLVEF